MSRRTGKAPIDPKEQQRLRDEQQRLWDEAEARRIEERQLEIEREPNPPEVLQYASPLLPAPLLRAPLSWRHLGLLSGLVVTQESRSTTSGAI